MCDSPAADAAPAGCAPLPPPSEMARVPGFTAPLPAAARPAAALLARARSPSRPRLNVVAVAESRPRPGRDFYGIPNPPDGAPLRLGDLRERLIRQEETIIFALIERAQFKLNAPIYTPGAFELPGFDGTFSQYLLYELEKVYAKVRRYTSPDEHPFAPPSILPRPILAPLDYPETLRRNSLNVNDRVESVYRDYILPGICEEGDDQNYGSSATCDVSCLQALSKRIHYGKFIAEAKCQENNSLYRELARKGDRNGIWGELSNLKVEKLLLLRVENKARSYGSDITVDGAREVYKVQPSKIAEMYEGFIIPLTKEVEVDYVLERYAQ